MASGAGSAQNDVVSRSDPEEQQQHEAESGGGSTAVRIIAAPSAPFCLRLRRLRAAAADDDEHRHHSSHTESWLRAMTLGAMDGIGSVASLILGVAGGSASRHVMLLAGVSAAVAGALSMAVSEYVSGAKQATYNQAWFRNLVSSPGHRRGPYLYLTAVSTQRDAEIADIHLEASEQEKGPLHRERELVELQHILEGRGLGPELARAAAEAMTNKNAVEAHAREELGLNVHALSNPLRAAFVGGSSFCLGAALPILSTAFIDDPIDRIASCVATSMVAFAFLGGLAGHLGGARVPIGILRVLVGGALELGVTYGIGRAVGSSGSSAH